MARILLQARPPARAPTCQRPAPSPQPARAKRQAGSSGSRLTESQRQAPRRELVTAKKKGGEFLPSFCYACSTSSQSEPLPELCTFQSAPFVWITSSFFSLIKATIHASPCVISTGEASVYAGPHSSPNLRTFISSPFSVTVSCSSCRSQLRAACPKPSGWSPDPCYRRKPQSHRVPT